MRSATFSRILEIFEIEVSLIPRILEILEIFVFLYIGIPGNIGNLIFLVSWDPGNIGHLSLQHFLWSWKYYPNPKPNPKSLFLTDISPCSAPDRPEATQVSTPPLFLCAGAVLESPRLAKGSPVPRRCLNGDPGVPKCAPRLPKVLQRGHKGSQKRDKRSAMQSPKHALALQSEFKGILYTPKLPINRSSGHYVMILTSILCMWLEKQTEKRSGQAAHERGLRERQEPSVYWE